MSIPEFLHSFFISVVFASATVTSVSGASTTNTQDLFCGLVKNHYLFEETNVTQGFVVLMEDGQIDPHSSEHWFRFYPQLRPGSIPVRRLEVANEKYMHVIGVSDDLSHFFHLHPRENSSGVWQVRTNLSPGRYKFWTDVKRGGSGWSFAHRPVVISGKRVFTEPEPRVFISSARLSRGFTLDCEHSKPLLRSETNWFVFSVRDSNGNVVPTEPYLGTAFHLSAIRDDLSLYLHSHPILVESGVCYLMFPQEGWYKLFVQCRPHGLGLLQDDALVGTYWIRVGSGGFVEETPIEVGVAQHTQRKRERLQLVVLYVSVFTAMCLMLWGYDLLRKKSQKH